MRNPRRDTTLSARPRYYTRGTALVNENGMGENNLSLDRLFAAFTDENQAFNFPIKYPAITLDRDTKNTLYTAAAVVAGGMIVAAILRR